MRTIPGCALAALILCSSLSADDKKAEAIDAKKLVGQWGPKEKPNSVSFTFEFTKDGKATATVIVDGKESKSEGTYKLDGNKLTVSTKVSDKEESLTRTVTKLTDTELVTKDDKGKERAFVRIKDK